MPGRDSFEAVALNVFRIDGGLITEEICFRADVFGSFGLPTTLD